MTKLTYKQAVRDIVAFVALADKETQVTEALRMNDKAHAAIADLCVPEGGYMVLTAFVVMLTEMKKLIRTAQGPDKTLLQGITEAAIGGLGKTLN